MIAVAKAIGIHDFITSCQRLRHASPRTATVFPWVTATHRLCRALLATPKSSSGEATSSVDTQTELAIQIALKDLTGRTAFIIAHRLSTIKRADRIVVIHGGRIVEEGKHDQLLAKDGLYRRLYASQFREA